MISIWREPCSAGIHQFHFPGCLILQFPVWDFFVLDLLVFIRQMYLKDPKLSPYLETCALPWKIQNSVMGNFTLHFPEPQILDFSCSSRETQIDSQ